MLINILGNQIYISTCRYIAIEIDKYINKSHYEQVGSVLECTGSGSTSQIRQCNPQY